MAQYYRPFQCLMTYVTNYHLNMESIHVTGNYECHANWRSFDIFVCSLVFCSNNVWYQPREITSPILTWCKVTVSHEPYWCKELVGLKSMLYPRKKSTKWSTKFVPQLWYFVWWHKSNSVRWIITTIYKGPYFMEMAYLWYKKRIPIDRPILYHQKYLDDLLVAVVLPNIAHR